MQRYVILACGLAVGFVVGMGVPREELLRLRRQRAQDAQRLARCDGGEAGGAFGALLDVARPSRAQTPSSAAIDAGVVAATAGADGGLVASPTASEPAPVDDSDRAPEAPPDRYDGGVPRGVDDEAEDGARVLDLRAAQARAALREQAGLDDAAMAQLDTITQEMNAELQRRVAASFVRARANGGVVTRRELMEFAADGLDIVLRTDDRMREMLGPDAAASLDPGVLDPFLFVSGETAVMIQSGDDLRFEGE